MKKMNDSSKISGSCCPMKRYKLPISEKNNIFVMAGLAQVQSVNRLKIIVYF